MAADPNDADLLAVATAYRNARIAGETDNAAYVAAVAAYRERHPRLESQIRPWRVVTSPQRRHSTFSTLLDWPNPTVTSVTRKLWNPIRQRMWPRSCCTASIIPLGPQAAGNPCMQPQ